MKKTVFYVFLTLIQLAIIHAQSNFDWEDFITNPFVDPSISFPLSIDSMDEFQENWEITEMNVTEIENIYDKSIIDIKYTVVTNEYVCDYYYSTFSDYYRTNRIRIISPINKLKYGITMNMTIFDFDSIIDTPEKIHEYSDRDMKIYKYSVNETYGIYFVFIADKLSYIDIVNWL